MTDGGLWSDEADAICGVAEYVRPLKFLIGLVPKQSLPSVRRERPQWSGRVLDREGIHCHSLVTQLIVFLIPCIPALQGDGGRKLPETLICICISEIGSHAVEWVIFNDDI